AYKIWGRALRKWKKRDQNACLLYLFFVNVKVKIILKSVCISLKVGAKVFDSYPLAPILSNRSFNRLENSGYEYSLRMSQRYPVKSSLMVMCFGRKLVNPPLLCRTGRFLSVPAPRWASANSL